MRQPHANTKKPTDVPTAVVPFQAVPIPQSSADLSLRSSILESVQATPLCTCRSDHAVQGTIYGRLLGKSSRAILWLQLTRRCHQQLPMPTLAGPFHPVARTHLHTLRSELSPTIPYTSVWRSIPGKDLQSPLCEIRTCERDYASDARRNRESL
jgi:hypothetical protein